MIARLLIVAAAALVGYLFRRNALDDPYVTYRYADNILAGIGPVYNQGERILSTTALGYAFVLAALSPLAELPGLSNALSAIGLAGVALALHQLAHRNGLPWAGLGAALLALLSPLLLSTFGLETCAFLALVAWSAVAWDAGRWRSAAVLAAVATLIRSDGVLAFAVFATIAATRDRRPPIVPAAIYAALALPYEAALWLYYGSPTPTTLSAKVAQATIGGWPNYVGGLTVGIAEAVRASPLAWLAAPMLALGTVTLPRHRWAVPLIAWGVAQGLVYQLLGVASYTWYYAPLVPAAAVLVALGASAIARARPAIALLVIAPLLWVEGEGVRTLRASTPEPRALAYQRVGQWLDANAAPTDRVAVMEVGILGYYARRPMVDLLGLIRPETVAALHRQDFFWTIADSQAELVALTGTNPLWFQFAEPGHWFHQLYAPVERFDQPGFWGSPMTVYRRQAPIRATPALDDRQPELRFGESIQLDRVVVERLSARPGDYLTVQLFWRAGQAIDRDYAAFVHVVSAEPKVVAQHDTPVIATRWPVGQSVQYYHPMRLPDDLAPGRYTVEIGLYLPEEPMKRLSPGRPHARDVAVVAELVVP